jgi:hypothetical protein
VNIISSQHSEYIDHITKSIAEMEALVNRKMQGSISADLLHRVRVSITHYIASNLVQSFAKVKVCSTEGRSLMSLDVNVLKSALESLFNLKPLPHWTFIVDYITAYYYPENDFLNWYACTYKTIH